LSELGVNTDRIDIHRVPGAFELPVAAKMLIDAGRVQAVIWLSRARAQLRHRWR
jgi:6,7-dimethyl-8-ribityllumazine synthase